MRLWWIRVVRRRLHSRTLGLRVVSAGSHKSRVNLENTKMDIFEQLKGSNLIVVIVVVGVVALFLAIKIAHVIFRMVFALIGLAAIGGAVWWFFLKH